MVSRAALYVALTTLAAATLCPALYAAGPVFVPPLDNALLRGEVLLRAEKQHLDGRETITRAGGDYIAYRVAPAGDGAADARFVAAVIYPYEFDWDTQAIHINPNDPWDPLNGSRKYPDGEYTITAVAFNARGERLGDPTTVTVYVANNVTNPPLDANGRMLLRPGGTREQEMRYRAEGDLYARLTDEARDASEDPLQPPFVEMKMGAEWRNVYRKPFSPGHTVDGRRFHGEDHLSAPVSRDPARAGRYPDWRASEYAVCDTYPEHGWVEMVGLSLSQLEDWRERPAALFVPDPTATLFLGGPAAMGTGVGDMGAGPGMPGGADMGAMPGMGPGMAPGMGAMGGMEAGMAGMPGDMGMPGVGTASPLAAMGGLRTLDRAASFMPVNLPGLNEKFRSVLHSNGVMGKIRHNDRRWPLAELWTPLPDHPVAPGETWSGPMTVLPFLDQQYHIRVNSMGGSVSGPTHEDPLLHHTRRMATPIGGGQPAPEVRPGGRNGPIVHVLDGFEYYNGYECARIVSRFRNYSDRDSWDMEHMTGWLLGDLQPRMIGSGTIGPTSLVQTDLVRITYYAYRAGHIVGMEDYYHNKLWISEGGFGNLVATAGRTRGVREGYQPRDWPTGRPTWTRDTREGLLGAAPGAPAAGIGMPGMDMGPGMDDMGMGMGAPGMPGMGMPGAAPGMGGMEMPGAGMPGMDAAPGATAEAGMAHIVANVAIKVREVGGSDDTHRRIVLEDAQLPRPQRPAVRPPGPRDTAAQATQRYVVVEDTGVFYLATSPLLSGQRGVALDTTADQLVRLGFKPAPDLKLD